MSHKDIFCKYPPQKDNLIAILHEIQNLNPQQYITIEDIKEVSDYLNISTGYVYGVISYYSMFSLKPRGKNLIRICESPVCQMKGSYIVEDKIKSILGIDIDSTTSDGLFTIERCQCLGNCQSAPGFSINNDFFGDANKEELVQIIKGYKSTKNDN